MPTANRALNPVSSFWLLCSSPDGEAFLSISLSLLWSDHRPPHAHWDHQAKGADVLREASRVEVEVVVHHSWCIQPLLRYKGLPCRRGVERLWEAPFSCIREDSISHPSGRWEAQKESQSSQTLRSALRLGGDSVCQMMVVFLAKGWHGLWVRRRNHRRTCSGFGPGHPGRPWGITGHRARHMFGPLVVPSHPVPLTFRFLGFRGGDPFSPLKVRLLAEDLRT